MKVKLIFPRLEEYVDTFHENSLISKIVRRQMGAGMSNHVPPLSLLMLGAVTPEDVDLRLIDERVEEDDPNDEVDLVGITMTTRAASRGYEIAGNYRRRGVKVVVGGVHPSVVPEESSRYADVVVVGEGENIWPQILSDFENDRLKPVYREKAQISVDDFPLPRRELIANPENYVTLRTVSSSRGCPNSCTFCTAGSAGTKRYRTRNVQEVVAEIRDLPGTLILFTDDNLGWDVERSKELLRALVPLDALWVGGASLSAFEDPEFVDLVAESGCIVIEIGFESLRPATIREMRKTHTNHPERYREIIAAIHRREVMIKGNFVVGFDTDDHLIFDELMEFVDQTNIEMPSINTLTPYPGTRVFRQFDSEGRLLHKDWKNYDKSGGSVVYQPKNMTANELKQGYLKAKESVFSRRSMMRRLIGAGTFLRGKAPTVSTLAAVHWNMQNRRGVALEKRM